MQQFTRNKFAFLCGHKLFQGITCRGLPFPAPAVQLITQPANVIALDPPSRALLGLLAAHAATTTVHTKGISASAAAWADPDGWHDGTVWSPLALAAWYAHPDVVAVLLDGGACVEDADGPALRAGMCSIGWSRG